MEISPGFEAIRGAVASRLGKPHTTVVSTSSAIQLRIMDAFAGDPEFVDALASGGLELITVPQLVSKLCAAAGVATMPTLDIDRQAALIGLFARELSDASVFAGSKHLPGFYAAAAKTLQEMRHERVRLDSLSLGKGKLHEVALLQEGLEGELRRRSYSTLSERMDAVLAAPPTRPEELKQVLWLPEREWPELRLQLADWLLRAGIELCFAAERHPADAAFFSATVALKERFTGATLETRDTPLPPGAALFAEDEFVTQTGDLTILQASDDFIETEWAISQCRKRIRNDGLDPKDIVIFARSLESYGPLLRAASDREGQPIAIDYSEPLTAHPFTRYVLCALRSLTRNSVGAMVGLIRSSYGQVPAEEREVAEKCIRSLATSDDLWRAAGAEAKRDRSPLPAWMAEVARWRAIAKEGPRKPSDWMRGLDQLIAATPWLTSGSSREVAVRDRLIRTLNIGLLALDPHPAFPLAEFVEFVERTWSSFDYQVRTEGGIRVVSDPSAIGSAKAVIAVGVVEGRFPSRRAEDPILLDRDRLALAEVDPRFRLPDSYRRSEEDRRDFYRLLCSSFDVTLCFPNAVGEDEQSRAAYLWDLEKIPGVRVAERAFSQRFPEASECSTEADMLASIVWHGAKFDPYESIVARAKALRAAFDQSQKSGLTDDILRAKLALVPSPLHLSHLLSLAQCPFQYFARHKLRLRSGKSNHANRVIVNAIRRSNFHLTNVEAFRDSLLKSLDAELESMQGVLSDHEMQVVRFAAPATLEQFAKLEMKSRKEWQLTPVQVAPDDSQSGLRRSAKFGDVSVTISPAIDVLYKREGTNDLVPMRIGWESEGDETRFENHLVTLMHPGKTKFAMFDAYNNSRRTLYCRKEEGRERLKSGGNLSVDIGPKQIRELTREVKARMTELLAVAKSGEPQARPNKANCDRCDLGSFCRSAPYADPAVDWAATIEEEE